MASFCTYTGMGIHSMALFVRDAKVRTRRSYAVKLGSSRAIVELRALAYSRITAT